MADKEENTETPNYVNEEIPEEELSPVAEDTEGSTGFMFRMLNNYMSYFNEMNNTKKNMFDGIDYSDETSTNLPMAAFYNLMSINTENTKNHPDKVKVYYEDSEEMKHASELYALRVDNKIVCYSQDVFELFRVLTENNYKRWRIETLR